MSERNRAERKKRSEDPGCKKVEKRNSTKK